MPAAGSSTRRTLRVLGEQHADFEPLLFAVGEFAGEPVALGVEADGAEEFVDAVAVLGGRAVEQRGEDAARTLEGEEEVFPDGVVAVDGWASGISGRCRGG
jgi:hypothetical protein